MSDAGKGDDYRPYNVKKFNENFDRIFGNKGSEEKHTAYVWAKKAKVVIQDPDGWRVDNKSLHASITKSEFRNRLEDSTVMMMDIDAYNKFFK